MQRVLVANRGEIAVRIFRACRELGLTSIAVYPPVDQGAPHLDFADEVFELNTRKGYLDRAAILETAKEAKADAIHPGYGFLAENADFARECQEAGLIFVGPPADAIEAMGIKTTARRLMEEAGVPVVPGCPVLADAEEAKEWANRIGYPVLCKASAGGGGRGIRTARNEVELVDLFSEAKEEAELAFGSGDVYLEKYLVNPRHVEIQVLADDHGNVIHLGERECSIQRRRQKLIEESPSVVVDESLRQRMGEAAVRAAEAVGYRNAGTVECLLDADRNFYFLEMNTRIQVEHPITEMTTGVDLVKEQLRIAQGKPISIAQEDVAWTGWAFEFRINAEDPDRDFRPTPGKVTGLRVPNGPWTRVDTAMVEGSMVSPFFDSLMGKLVVWGRDRDEAIARSKRALSEFSIAGVKSTIPVMLKVLDTEEFRTGAFDVDFLERWLAKQG